MNYPLNLILHENQKLINKHPAKFRVIKAGKRFGKTKLALYRIVRKAFEFPGETFWYIAPTYRQAKNIAWHELNWLIPKELIKRSVENELTKEFVNGSRLQLIGADNPDSLRGPKLRHATFDEAAYIAEDIWPTIIAGQLLGNVGGGTADFISSPNDKGRNWYSNFWDDAKLKEQKGDKDWAAFYYTIYDNPTIPRDEIDRLREQVTDDKWQVEYMAIESALSGIRFSEFNKDNVGELKWENPILVRAIDWGIAHPTTCLFLQVDMRNKLVYVEDEYFKSGFLIKESCEVIKQMTGSRDVAFSVIDPATCKRDAHDGRTDKDEFGRYGIYCLPGDNRNRGYDIVKMFLKHKRLIINPKCKNLLYELKNLQYGDKTGDDATDALRYGLVRIHDYMAGMNISQQENLINYDDLAKRNKYSLYDERLFPKDKKQERNWVLQEAV